MVACAELAPAVCEAVCPKWIECGLIEQQYCLGTCALQVGFARVIGDACATAYEGFYACEAELECAELEADHCPQEASAAEQACAQRRDRRRRARRAAWNMACNPARSMRGLRITWVSFVFAATSIACNAKPEIESFVHTLTTGGAADEATTGIIEATTSTTEPSCSIVGDGDTGGDCAPDEKCNVHFALGPDAVPQCVSLDGDDQPGEECTAQQSPPIDTCAAGSTCLTNDLDRNGRCVQLCDASLACEAAVEICAPVFDGALPLCVEACDPLDPAACVDDWICHELPAQAVWYCAPRLRAQTGGHGSPCSPDAQGVCAPGFACLAAPNTVDNPLCTGGDTGGGCCAMLCDLGDDESACPSEVEQCVPYYNVPPPGMENVGICALSLSRPRQTPGPDPIPPRGPGGPD